MYNERRVKITFSSRSLKYYMNNITSRQTAYYLMGPFMNIKIFILMAASVSFFSSTTFAQTKSNEKTAIDKTTAQKTMVLKKMNGKNADVETQATKNGDYDFYRIEGHQGYVAPLTDCVTSSGATDKNCNGIDDTKETKKLKNDRRISERLRHKSRK